MHTEQPAQLPSEHPTPVNTNSTDEQGYERLVFFSDAVFAIALTLMALEIRLPQVYESEIELRQALLDLTPAYLAYVISFVVVGLFWLAHHRKFRYIKRYDPMLLRINLLLLMVIAIVPFVSGLLSEYRYSIIIVLYAGVMFTIATLSALLNWYALHYDLVEHTVTPQERASLISEPLKMAGVFLLSMAVALWNPRVAMLTWLLVIPASMDIRIPWLRTQANTQNEVSRR